jgi:YesN/AraC family two-component response regulator
VTKPLLLWVDLTAGLPDAESRVQSATIFQTIQVRGMQQAAAEIVRQKPHALCFDFDYPDQGCLQAMQAIKKSNPRLPILMLTREHSEALAVWAFRARVWNYLVKPVSQQELKENFRALAGLGGRIAQPRAVQMLESTVPADLPPEPVSPEKARLRPAIDYVARHYHAIVSATAAARLCGLTRFEFSRKFRAAFKMTFREHLLRVRIMEARRLLTEGRVSITGVAYSVGFNDGSHFATMFKRFTGLLPSEYVERQLVTAEAASQAPDLGLRRRASDKVSASPV